MNTKNYTYNAIRSKSDIAFTNTELKGTSNGLSNIPSLTILKGADQTHPFHLVDSSPWPLQTSVILGTVAASFVLTFAGADHASLLLLLTVIALVTNMSL